MPRLSFRPSFSSAGWGRTNHVDLPNQLFVRTWMGALHLGGLNVKSFQVYSIYGSRPKCSGKSTNRLQISYGFPDVTSTFLHFVWLATSTLDPCIANVAWCFLCHVCMIFFVLLFSPMLHLDLEKCVNYSCLVRPISLYCPGWNKAHKLCIRLQQDSSWKTCLQSQNPTKISSMLNLGLNQIISCSVDAICAVQEDIGRVVRWHHALSVKKPVNLHMQKFDEDSETHETPCPNCPFKLKLERLCHTMPYYVMLLTSTSVAEVSPLKQQSKNEVLLHRVRTPWVTKFQCRSLRDFLILRTQRNKIRKTAPQACPQAIMWAEWTLGIRGKVTTCAVATQFGFEFQIIVMNPTWRQMIGGVFENVSHESTLSLDHLGGWHRMPKACIQLKALWNSQNWRECSSFWSKVLWIRASTHLTFGKSNANPGRPKPGAENFAIKNGSERFRQNMCLIVVPICPPPEFGAQASRATAESMFILLLDLQRQTPGERICNLLLP